MLIFAQHEYNTAVLQRKRRSLMDIITLIFVIISAIDLESDRNFPFRFCSVFIWRADGDCEPVLFIRS